MTAAAELDDGQTLRVVPMFSGAGWYDDPLTVAYACLGAECAYVSDRVPVDELDVIEDVRRHLAGEHADVVGYGLCAKCGEVTDHFRAVVPVLVDGAKIEDTWLCENDAPALPVIVDQAGAGDEPTFDTLRPGSLHLTAIEGFDQ